MSIIIKKEYDSDDVLLIINPLFHMNSYANLIASIYTGNTIVIMKKFDPVEMMSLIESEKVTLCSIMPTISSEKMITEKVTNLIFILRFYYPKICIHEL